MEEGVSSLVAIMKLTRSQIIIIASLSITALLIAIAVPVAYFVHRNNHKEDEASTTVHSSSVTASSTTTTMEQMTQIIVKDLDQLKDTLTKFEDDVQDLMQNKRSAQIFREELEHFKSTTRGRPG